MRLEESVVEVKIVRCKGETVGLSNEMNALWTEHQCGELMCYQVQPNKTKCEAEGRRNGLDGSLQDGRHARLSLGWGGHEVIVTPARVDFF